MSAAPPPTSSTLREVIRRLLPLELRLGARDVLRDAGTLASPWRMRALAIEAEELAPFRLVYLGRAERLPEALDLLGLSTAGAPASLGDVLRPDDRSLVVSEGPLPGAVRVPCQLRIVVPLGRPIEQIMQGWSKPLRNEVRGLARRATLRPVTSAAEAVRVHRELIEPFARERHRDRAVVFSERDVLRLSRTGFVGAVALDGAEVAAILGVDYRRRGRRTFALLRVGFPAAVFTDGRRLHDANSAAFFFALRHAVESGYEDLDDGTAPARPDGGLLQHKRRRVGELSTFNVPAPFWIRLPPRGADELLFRRPLFSLDRAGLRLHVGAPDGTPEGAVVERLQKLGYRGLHAVRLHAERELRPELLARAAELFRAAPGVAGGTARWIEQGAWRGEARRALACATAGG